MTKSLFNFRPNHSFSKYSWLGCKQLLLLFWDCSAIFSNNKLFDNNDLWLRPFVGLADAFMNLFVKYGFTFQLHHWSQWTSLFWHFHNRHCLGCTRCFLFFVSIVSQNKNAFFFLLMKEFSFIELLFLQLSNGLNLLFPSFEYPIRALHSRLLWSELLF